MFAYIVKRLLTGVVVLVLVSMAIFALLWYGPESPARPICNQETSGRCTPERLANFEKSMGYDNPIYEEYGKFAKGIVAGREITLGQRRGRRLRCAVLRVLLPHPQPGLGRTAAAPARDHLGRRSAARPSTC